MTDFPLYTTRDLYAVMYDRRLAQPTTYWLDLCFPNSHMSTREEIVFEKLGTTRKVAPFVLPTNVGQPSYKRDSSTAKMFRPAYIKPKDRVNPSEMLSRQPGDLYSLTPRTPAQNFDAEVVKITQFHRDTIWRRWEWMAARSILDGAVTVDYADHPAMTVDFGRAAGHTVTLTGGARWGQGGVSIIDNLQTWMDTMQVADFGGVANRLTMGTGAWAIFRKDAEVKEQLDTRYRGTEANVKTGLLMPEPVRWVGNLGGNLDVYVYNDTYQKDDGSHVAFMDSRDVVLTAPGVEGVKAFGAIADAKAGLQPIDIFPKMWDDEDPSGRYIMSQSAPLMIPVNPNCTFKARVIS